MQELIYTKEFQIDATKADRWGRLAPMALLECMQAASTDHAELLGVGREALLRQRSDSGPWPGSRWRFCACRSLEKP